MSTIGKIFPSILAADLGRITETVQVLNAYDFAGIHFDVMDGHFVPEITFGAAVLTTIKANTRHRVSVHLMVSNPLKHLRRFIDAGADELIVHRENVACPPHHKDLFAGLGVSIGLAFNPNAPIDIVEPYFEMFNRLLIMSVNPGSCGQSFLPSTLDKITLVKERLRLCGHPPEVTVDGGINHVTLRQAITRGADSFVVGSALLGGGLKELENNISYLKQPL